MKIKKVLEARRRLRGSYRYVSVPWGLRPRSTSDFSSHAKQKGIVTRTRKRAGTIQSGTAASYMCVGPCRNCPWQRLFQVSHGMCRANPEPGNMPPAQTQRLLRIFRGPVAISKSKYKCRMKRFRKRYFFGPHEIQMWSIELHCIAGEAYRTLAT